jgi:membrane protein
MSDLVSTRINEHRSRETGRGRKARKPQQIPWRGWLDIVSRLRDAIAQDRVGTIAAGTTFFILLSLFPALAALVSLYGLVADPLSIGSHVAGLRGYVPSALIDLVEGELQRLTGNRDSTLGASFVVGLLLALWSANNGMKALFEALNVAYGETEKRGFFRLLFVSLVFTLGAILFFVLALNIIVGIPLAVKFLYLGPLGDALLAVLPALAMFAVAILGTAVLYRYGPSRRMPKWRWVTPGSFAAASFWLCGSALFSWYVANWGNYSATYGSLGAIVGVMMWIYLSLWIVLVGAELNAEIEHQTAQDTTTGPDRPLGARGAVMADDVGEARG